MFQRTCSSEAVWKAVLIIRAVSMVGLGHEAEGSSSSETGRRSCIEPCRKQKAAQFGLGGCFGWPLTSLFSNLQIPTFTQERITLPVKDGQKVQRQLTKWCHFLQPPSLQLIDEEEDACLPRELLKRMRRWVSAQRKHAYEVTFYRDVGVWPVKTCEEETRKRPLE